jgi:hypothetical protein
VRVTTAFNRLLALTGARVIDVIFGADGIVVRVALRRRRLVCCRCGQVYRATYDSSFRRWRHLDVAGRRCFIEYELRRVECRDCGVRVEAVPWARPNARHTRDFEDLVAFCAQQMAKSQVQALLRVAGTASGGSLSGSSPTTSTYAAWWGSFRSAATSCPTDAGGATSPTSPTTTRSTGCTRSRPRAAAATPGRAARVAARAPLGAR